MKYWHELNQSMSCIEMHDTHTHCISSIVRIYCCRRHRLFQMRSTCRLRLVYLVILCVSSSITAQSSLCAQYYSSDVQQQRCECDDVTQNGIVSISLKCLGHAYVPHFLPNIHYQLIELEFCSQDLQIGDKTFADLNINTLRLRHCNLIGLNEDSFGKINYLEKFSIENATITSLATSTGNFQEIFQADSFRNLKSLILKNVHYHQLHKHDKKLNLELLLDRLGQLHRLELINIYLDNYRYHRTSTTSQTLIYLKLINTHQTSLLPIEYLPSLESLILVHLPDIFRSQTLLMSIGKLDKLKYIDFSHNQLLNVAGLQSKTIDQIDLTSNLLSTIDEYAFEYLPKLRTLTLNGNPLMSIDSNAFCGIEKFERLYINIQKNHQFSPIDNCLLLDYADIDIKQDSQMKLQCNCRLVQIFQMKREQKQRINRLLKPNDVCLVTNETLLETRDSQQLSNHLHLPIYIYELEKFLNCSTNHWCSRACQTRKQTRATTPPSSTTIIRPSTLTSLATEHIHAKQTSRSISLDAFVSHTLVLLLPAFLYL
jgi:hypothetical protein